MNSNFNKRSRKINWYLIFMLSTFLVVGLFFALRQIAMLNTTKTCGKIIGEYKVRGHRKFELLYFVDGAAKKTDISVQAFKIKKLDELKKFECIEIEYSNYLPYYVGVIDTIVGSGQGW